MQDTREVDVTLDRFHISVKHRGDGSIELDMVGLVHAARVHPKMHLSTIANSLFAEYGPLLRFVALRRLNSDQVQCAVGCTTRNLARTAMPLMPFAPTESSISCKDGGLFMTGLLRRFWGNRLRKSGRSVR